jgi:hypothetical protein
MKHLSKAIASFLLPPSLLLNPMESASAADAAVDIFQWQERIFSGTTRYRGVTLNDERVLSAESNNSASALYQTHSVNLSTTPHLHWRWRIENTLGPSINEQSQEGDDFSARIYVVRNGGFAFWRSKSINYVWSNSQAIGTRWNNPFAGENIQMLAVDSGDQRAGQWQYHVRDIRADWLEVFGEDISSIDGLAIMTDTDNTGLSTRAWYADIYFSSSPNPMRTAD